MDLKSSNSVLSNLSWKFMERIMAQAVTTVVSIILARILLPEDYGVISIVSIFITVANVFVSDGVGSSLVQKKNADSLDYTTMLIFNVTMSVFLYLIIYFSAPFIAKFYGTGYEIVTPVLRVLGIRIILTGVNSIQSAYISKHLMFRKYFWSTIIGTVISAVVGISMAYMGYGVWALVFQYLINNFVGMIVLAFVIGKFPLPRFSFGRLKNLMGFGVTILGTTLLGTLFNQMRGLIIGKVYTSSDLAYFDKGQQFPSLIVTNINTSITAVMFPRMAMDQDDRARIKVIMKKSLRFSSYVISPILWGFAAIAPQFVSVVLTDNWLPCVPLLRLICIYYMFWPIHSLNMQVMKALGEGNKYLTIEFVKRAFDIFILLITFKSGVEAIAVGMVISSFASVIINAWPNKKLINYPAIEQLKDIMPNVIMSIIMAIAVYGVGLLPYNKLLLMIIQIVVGIIVYMGMSMLIKSNEYKEILNMVKGR